MSDRMITSDLERHRKARRDNAIRCELFLRALKKHHQHNLPDYNMKVPEGWVKREPEHSKEYKELWFGVPEDIAPLPMPRIEDVKRLVCRHFKITNAELLSPQRHEEIVLPRQIAMYLAKTLTNRSLPEIGRRFAGKDHTTVINAVRKIKRLCLTDVSIAHDVAYLEARLQ